MDLPLGVLLGLAAPGQEKLDILNLVLNASGVVMGVLGLLVFFSLVSWYIIAYKAFYLGRAARESERFLAAFFKSKRLDAIYQTAEELRRSPISQMFKAAYIELSKIKGGQQPQHEVREEGLLGDLQSIERALERARTSELTHLESMVPFLATTGSAAPFVGLFGTVWGIMNSFRNIGAQGAANLATVAPGIAEALIATAIGLMAAIPAVMAYNWFVRKIKVLSSEMDAFTNDFLNIVKRHFFK
jgi:biopolymer transport protein TolQ